MSAALILASYDGQAISFTGDGWFNATQAAAKFGKAPNDWLRLPATIDYIEGLKRKYGKFSYLRSQRGKGGGTWLHPKLAVHFARWLDVDFAIWCDEQIDNLLRGTVDRAKLRHQAASSFKVMNQILKLVREDAGKASAPYHYSNEARMVNWALSGVMGPLDRDAMSSANLDLLAAIEERNAVLIARGLDYDKRKVLLEQFAVDRRTLAIAA